MIQAADFQFLKSAQVIVEDILVADIEGGNVEKSLSVEFKVVKHVKLEPNTTEIIIHNLNQQNREKLSRRVEEAKKLSFEQRKELKAGQVKLSAGYSMPELISIANIRTANHEPQKNGGWVTRIYAEDGRDEWNSGFVKETFAAGGADLSTVKSTLAALAKLNEGAELEQAFQEALPDYELQKGSNGMKNGSVEFGPIRDRFGNLFETLGLRGWIDNGKLIVAPKNLPKKGIAVSLSPNTGLLRAKPTEDLFYEITALLNPKIEPGRQILLRDENEKPIGPGTFRVDHAEFIGATMGNDWLSTALLRPSALGAS